MVGFQGEGGGNLCNRQKLRGSAEEIDLETVLCKGWRSILPTLLGAVLIIRNTQKGFTQFILLVDIILLLEFSFPSVRPFVRPSPFLTCMTHACIIDTCFIRIGILHPTPRIAFFVGSSVPIFDMHQTCMHQCMHAS